ncbi:MAG: hypothetical protein KGJ99_06830 [Betaproteobacteria bacterium]|nr:hypothetical protein [Betaproteobacteria bacterium]MDE2209420.1 hypothetical protein [Betaproteobacteria bacterium]
MTLEQRVQALLDLVESERRTRSDAIVGEARSRAFAVLAQAHASARARMREAYAEERQRAHARVAAALANLQTRRRLHEQQRSAALLALAWQRLPEALRARWRDAGPRRLWVDAAVAEARRVLPHGQWRVIHATDWPAGEQQAFVVRLAIDSGVSPGLSADSGIDAGLRIVAGGNVVDATLAGLVVDRDEIGARLLRQLEQSP